MVETAPELDELGIIDDLLLKLERLITEAEEAPLTINHSDRPLRATYRPTGSSVNALDRKPNSAEAVFLDAERLVLQCQKTEMVRLMTIEATLLVGKNGRGETNVVVTGAVTGLKRVRGGYEMEIGVGDTRRVMITPGQKLRESVERDDAAGWNRWCREIRDRIDLTGLSLPNANLAGYDLCCADLAGADLSGADLTNTVLAGADLSGTNLDDAKAAGADFFRAKIQRKYAALPAASGLPEMESVEFVVGDRAGP